MFTLTALAAVAAYKYVSSKRNGRVAEEALVSACFPLELQQQILCDFGAPVAVFCANRLQRRQMIMERRTLENMSREPQQDQEILERKAELQAKPEELQNVGSGHVEDLAQNHTTNGSAITVDGSSKKPSIVKTDVLKDGTEPVTISRFSFGGLFNTLTHELRSKYSNQQDNKSVVDTQPPTPFCYISPSADSKDWNYAEAKTEAERTILLLWAIVDVLKKRVQSHSVNAENDIKKLEVSLSSSTDDTSKPPEPAADVNNDKSDAYLESITQRDASAEQMTTPPSQSREYSILRAFETITLISLLQMIHALETLLLEKMMLLKLFRSSSSLTVDSPITEPVSPGDLGTSKPSILHKISLGWGAVGLMLDATSKEELVQLEEQGAVATLEGESDGFLVATITCLLKERNVHIEPVELLKL